MGSARGRADSVAELRRHLATAPPAYLEGAVENPELGIDEALLLLRNRSATSNVLVRVGRARALTRSYEIKKGLVRHARTPPSLARAFLPQLYWKDLAEISDDPRAQAALRHHADEMLAHRLGDLSLGEKVSLARRASPRVVSTLRTSREAAVLKAVLSNPRLLERDAVGLAADPGAPRDALGYLAAHAVWVARYPVRISLVGNPQTPIAAALRLLDGLPARDLERIASDEAVPKIVRVRAERSLAEGPRTRRVARGG